MDNDDNNKRLSVPTPKAATKSINSYRSLRTDNRKPKSRRPIEAISEVALNTLDAKSERTLKVKRLHSAPETNQTINDNNNVSEEKKQANRNSLRTDREDEKVPIDEVYDNRMVHYSPDLRGNHQVHYISGHVNQGFVGQLPNIPANRSITSISRVQREQYWTWPCCQRRGWTRREKILSVIIGGQCIIIFLLAVALVWVVLANDVELGTNPSPIYPPWKLP